MCQTMVVSPYANYDFYTDTFHGDNMTEDEFEKYEARGEDLVDIMTFDRIPDIPEELMTERLAMKIRKAVCAAAEQYRQQELYMKAVAGSLERAAGSGGVSSEHNDGYSVSYQNVLSGYAGSTSASAMRQVYEDNAMAAVRRYLTESGLLFRGTGGWHQLLMYTSGGQT